MSEHIKSVGRVGVAQVQCVGGPHDGESHWAVMGSAVVLMVPRPVKQPKATGGGFWVMSFSSDGPADGEEWKDAKKKAPKTPVDTYAAYCPDIRNGKAIGFVRFEGLFRVPQPTPPPTPEGDEDDDDE